MVRVKLARGLGSLALAFATASCTEEVPQYTEKNSIECMIGYELQNEQCVWIPTSSSIPILPQHAQGPMDQLVMNVRHMGDPGSAELTGEVANPVTWDVSYYSGFKPPEPISNYQKGFLNEGAPRGTNAFQAYGDTVGGIINTWSFPHSAAVVGGGPHYTVSYNYSQPARAWISSNSKFTLQMYAAIPWVGVWGNGVGQLCMFLYLKDTSTNQVFAYVVEVFDSRPFGQGNGSESIGFDTFTSFVSTPLLASSQYISKTANSASLQNSSAFANEQFFEFQITAANLANAIQAVKSQSGNTALSNNLGDYVITSYGAINEVFVGTDPNNNISIGTHVRMLKGNLE